MLRNALFTLVLGAFALPGTGIADTLLLEDVAASQESAAQRPARGMTMEEVTGRWGEPAVKDAAVGEPPIVRWEYTGFIVYFESNAVIHSVKKRS